MRPENLEEARGDAGLAGKTVAGRRRDGPRAGPPIRGTNAFRSSSRPGGGSVASSIGGLRFLAASSAPPSWIRILDQLREEHQAVARRDELARTICSSFGLEGDFDQFEVALSSLQKTVDKLPDSVRSLHVMASAGGDGPSSRWPPSPTIWAGWSPTATSFSRRIGTAACRNWSRVSARWKTRSMSSPTICIACRN